MKKKAGLIIAIITFIVLYFTLKNNYKLVINLLFSANIWWIFISLCLALLYIFLMGLVTRNLVGEYKKFSIFKAFKFQLMTNFCNAATPFSSGGPPFQLYQFKKEGLRINNGTSIIIKAAIINETALLITILVSLSLNLIFDIFPMTPLLTSLLAFGVFVNALFLVVIIIIPHNKKVLKKIIKFVNNLLFKLKIVKDKEKSLEKWNTFLEDFSKNSKVLVNDKKRFLKLIMLNVLALTSLNLIPLTILFSFNNFNAYNIMTSIVLTSFVSIIGSFVPLPGGSGGQEYSFILLYSRYITDPLLSSVMLLWRFMSYYFPMIIGAIIFNLKGERK